MRAAYYPQPGEPSVIQIGSFDTPAIDVDQILIQVEYAGANWPDALRGAGKYQARDQYPLILGKEVVGEVVAVGPSVSDRVVGQRVLAFLAKGGYAEQVAVDATHTWVLPPNLDGKFAVCLPTAFGTAYYGLHHTRIGNLQPGQTLLVTGASGGVGLAAVKLGKMLGARVIATASSEAKLEIARAAGADACVCYGDRDAKAVRESVVEACGGEKQGLDLVLDTVGREDLINGLIFSMRRFGKWLVVGFASTGLETRIPRLALNGPLLRECSVQGFFWSDHVLQPPFHEAALIEDLVGMAAAKRFSAPPISLVSLDQCGEYLGRLASGNLSGKLVFAL